MNNTKRNPIEELANKVGDLFGDIIADKIVAKSTAAIEKVDKIVKSKAMSRPAKSGPSTPKVKGRPAPKPVKPVKGKKKAAPEKKAKRTQEEVDASAEKLMVEILSTPGQTMEQLSKALGASTAELQLPMARLFGQNSRGHQNAPSRVRSEGQKRATRYYPTAGEATRTEPVAPEAAPQVETEELASDPQAGDSEEPESIPTADRIPEDDYQS